MELFAVPIARDECVARCCNAAEMVGDVDPAADLKAVFVDLDQHRSAVRLHFCNRNPDRATMNRNAARMIARPVGKFEAPLEGAGRAVELMDKAAPAQAAERSDPDMLTVDLDPLDVEQLSFESECAHQLGVLDADRHFGRRGRHRQAPQQYRECGQTGPERLAYHLISPLRDRRPWEIALALHYDPVTKAR